MALKITDEENAVIVPYGLDHIHIFFAKKFEYARLGAFDPQFSTGAALVAFPVGIAIAMALNDGTIEVFTIGYGIGRSDFNFIQAAT